MKKKLTYRDKLIELAYIYDVKEIKDYEKSRKNLTSGQLELILKKNKIISKVGDELEKVFDPEMPSVSVIKLGLIYDITVSDDEYECMSCNVLALAPREVVILENCLSLKNKLLKQNCIVHTYKGEEISLKGEGGPTCLTRPLLRI